MGIDVLETSTDATVVLAGQTRPTVTRSELLELALKKYNLIFGYRAHSPYLDIKLNLSPRPDLEEILNLVEKSLMEKWEIFGLRQKVEIIGPKGLLGQNYFISLNLTL